MSSLKIIWLIPSLGRGATGYPWHPVFKAFVQRFPNTEIFTTRWPGFANGYTDSFSVSTVGKPFKDKLFKPKGSKDYGAGFIPLPFSIAFDLIKLKPNVIITKAFSIWSAIAVLYKFFSGNRIVIAYEGSSPKVDYQNSKIRTIYRRLLTNLADAFVTNTHSGKAYLSEVLGANPDAVFVSPYEIASAHLLFESKQIVEVADTTKRPIFITVGQLIPRKGINYLLDACVLLKEQGFNQYTVLIAGNGPQQQELETFVKDHSLENQVKFLGWVDYSSLGYYFEISDIFVFPTLADTWGLVTLEAMATGTPALCSEYAGTAEIVIEGETGYIFNPQEPQKLADIMRKFILNPKLAEEMGKKAKQSMDKYTPENVAQSLQEVIDFAVSQ